MGSSEREAAGRSFPLGATVAEGGVNFCIFSRHATAIELLLFDGACDAEPARAVRLDAPRHRSYLDERIEMARLLAEQALQLLLSPLNKRHVSTFLQGMWAARRHAKIQERKMRREIRELG